MNIHFWTFIFQIVNFVVVAYVLHRLLYRPLHEAIDRRREATLKAQTDAERAQKEAEALRARFEAQLAEAERQREQWVREAHRQAEAEGQRLLDDARRIAQQQADEASRQLADEREEALAAVRQEIVHLAVDLTQRFLKQSADRTLHGQLVARLIGSLATVSADDRRQLLIGWQPGDPIIIETAEELDRESLDSISAAVAGLVGRQAAIEVKTNPALISGVCLRLGGHVWDASLNGSLEEFRHAQANAQEVAHA
ncbi:MAG TPA: F0F1 ATP synthase subunit delta [Pirellulales bacterium]|nr:F0F1 ATP synthase subunit delta [Pirellulales bacterium]